MKFHTLWQKLMPIAEEVAKEHFPDCADTARELAEDIALDWANRMNAKWREYRFKFKIPPRKRPRTDTGLGHYGD